MALCRRRKDPARGRHVEPPLQARPGQHAEVLTTRDRLPQGPRAQASRRVDQALPPHPRALLHPEQPVQPRSERVGVDEQRRGAQGVPLGERAGQRRRPGPTHAAHHADGAPRRDTLTDVGQGLHQPRGSIRQVDHRRRPDRHRGPEDGVGRRQADHVHVGPSRRGERHDPVGEVDPDQHQLGAAPGREAEGGIAAHLHLDARGRAERDDGVVDGTGSGEEEDGHGDEPAPRHRRRPVRRTHRCGQGLPEAACGRLMARPPCAVPPTMSP